MMLQQYVSTCLSGDVELEKEYLRAIGNNQPVLGPDDSDSLHLSGALGLLHVDLVGTGGGMHGCLAAISARATLFRTATDGVVDVGELALLTQPHTGQFLHLRCVSARHS